MRECPRTDGMKLCEEILIDTAKRQQMAKREPPTMQEQGAAFRITVLLSDGVWHIAIEVVFFRCLDGYIQGYRHNQLPDF